MRNCIRTVSAFGLITLTSAVAAVEPTPDLSGDWTTAAQGCDRAGSFLASQAAKPGTIIRITQGGTALTISVMGKTQAGEPFSFEAPGGLKGERIVVFDPLNSSYPFQGQVVADAIALRPDTRRTLGAWPRWANPPEAADLDSCVVTLRKAAAGTPVPTPPVQVNPYVGIPPGMSAFLDRDSLVAKSDARTLERKLGALRKDRHIGLAVLVVSAVSPETIEAYARRAANAYGSGVLLVIANAERSAYLALDEEAAAKIPPERARAVVDGVVVPRLAAGSIYDAATAGIDAIVAALNAT